MTPPRNLLGELAAQAPAPVSPAKGNGTRPRPAGQGDYSTLDVEAWFSAHGAYGRDMGDKHAVLCPWHDEHTNEADATASDTVVWPAEGEQWPNFNCKHSHCQGRTMRDVMERWGDADQFCTREFNGDSRTFTLKRTEPEKNITRAAEDTARLAQALETGRAVVAAFKEDRGAIFTPAALEALALIRKYDAENWARLREPICTARLIRVLEEKLPRVALPSRDPETESSDQPRTAGESLMDCSAPGLVIPSPYFLTETQTARMGADEDGSPRISTVAHAPILITGRAYDAITGAESLLLAWRWPRSGWRSRIIERSSALATRKLIELSAFGFPVADDNSQHIVGFLHRLEAANRPTLPCAKVSTHLGWQGEAEHAPFLCGRKLILTDGTVQAVNALDVDHPETWSEERVCFHGADEGQEQVADAFQPRGSLSRWRETVALAREYPRALLGFYASFAAPLLPLFNVANFIVDFSNDTTTGKTTVLRLAASVWGNPDERTACSVILTWDASRVGLERTSEVLSCLPLCVDDTKKAKNPRMVADLIYAVTSGRGRTRGTIHGLARTPVWRTVMLSTGEQPATSFTQDGGTRTRTLAVKGMPFNNQDATTGNLAARLNSALCQHHGHAGPLFISWLQKNRHTWDEWRERWAVLEKFYSLNPGGPESGRLAAYAALVVVAGEMAHEALGLPWEFVNPLDTLWYDLANAASDAAGSVRALEDILSWAEAREHSFIGRLPHDGFLSERKPPLVLGRWDKGDDWEYLAIYPPVLREALTELGYSAEAIIDGWKERGWLDHREGKKSMDIPTGEGTATRKMIAIRRAAFDATV